MRIDAGIGRDKTAVEKHLFALSQILLTLRWPRWSAPFADADERDVNRLLGRKKKDLTSGPVRDSNT